MDILCGKLAMKLGIPQAITFYIDHQEEIREAKEMEKERAIKFACDVYMNVKKDKVKSLMQLVDEKYNETYGGGEQ